MAIATLEQKQRNREYQRIWRANNPEKAKEYNRRWRENNPEKSRQIQNEWRKKNPDKVKSYNLKYLYGISLEQKVLMHERQDGKCLFCQNEFDCSDLVVDHCHNSGKVRSLLCNSCNTGFGLFYENAETLRRAADFVEGRITVPS
jgi:hypothetical protein